MIGAAALSALLIASKYDALVRLGIPSRLGIGTGRTEKLVAGLGAAVTAYRLDWGSYPPPSNRSLVRALKTRSPNSLPYFDFDPDSVNLSGEVVDQWGRPLVFGVPAIPSQVGPAFLLYSAGKDGVDAQGQGDDIVFGRKRTGK